MGNEEQQSSATSPGVPKKPPAREENDRIRQKVVSVLFFAFFFLLWLCLYYVNRELLNPKPAEPGLSMFVVIEIKPGSSMKDIAAKLSSQKLISNQFLFEAAAAARGSTRRLKAGEYRFDRAMSPLQILEWLEQGHVTLRKFTIPEGSTVEQIAHLLDTAGLAKATEILALSNDSEFCKEVGVDGSNLEGFLFPETYKIAKGLPARRILQIMVDRFWRVWNAENAISKNPKHLEMNDLISIASIIEKEAIYSDEKFLISSVIYNRMKKKMRLQCDVTIRYPLNNYGVELTDADLRFDSPYNSYLHAGLPPTPICNPGLIAIRAALNPPQTDYIYFVSMNNGRHKFSKTLQEHNEAVLKYQIRNERG